MSNEELVMEIQAGRNATENLAQLWEQNRRAVWQQARRYSAYADMDDLMQEGYLTLHKAAHEHDPARGAFITLLYKCLPRAFNRYIGQQATVQIPEYERRNIGELDQLEKRFLMEYGRYPTVRESCCLLRFSPEQLDRIKQSRQAGYIDSLDRSLDLEDGEVYLMDTVAAPGTEIEDLEEEMYQESLKAALWGAVDSLEPEQADVIRRRFVADQTLQATGEAHGKSRDWARQTEARALRKLRNGKNRRILLPFMDDRIYSAGMRGVGVERFRETWTSATEREALQRIR